MKSRIKCYNILHNKLKNMTSEMLNNIFIQGIEKKYKNNSYTKISGYDVFMKKIPLTTLEYNNMFDTSNLYNLPTFYNYPIGSAGINCFRELTMHIKTTNWVLEGKIKHFIMMYHYRIIKKENHIIDDIQKENINKKVETKWNGNKNIKKYLIERLNAPYEIIVVMEYFPITLNEWLKQDITNVYSYKKQIYPLLNFLQEQHVIHFDSHSKNFVVSKEGIIYMIDFGLVLDLEFNLTKEEIKFFNKNTMFDYGLSIMNILLPLLDHTIYIKDITKQTYFIDKYKMEYKAENEINNIKTIYKNSNEICDYLDFPRKYKKIVEEYKKLDFIMQQFIIKLLKNKKTIFPNNMINNN
jgi:serine/threonine protein kinase